MIINTYPHTFQAQNVIDGRGIMAVEVKLLSRDDRKAFIRFPWTVYKDDPKWVPHLLIERSEFLDPSKNPFFDHAEVAYFGAYKDGVMIGRIAAIVNHAHNQFHQDHVGFFGLFECKNDLEAAHALFSATADFLKSKGMTTMRGPMNVSTNDECGLLIDGFDEPAVVMMTYNPTYYIDLLENTGFVKSKDLWAHKIDHPTAIPERLKRGIDLILKRNEFTIRTINMKDFNGEVRKIRDIYNSAWEKNWGFVPMTDAEFDHLGKQMKQILDPEFLFIAEHKGRPVGFSLTIPNINDALIHIKNGRLLPFGIFKLLWHTRKSAVKSLRVLTLGITKEHRSSGMDVVFYYKTYEAAVKRGIQWAEMSWILEDNTPMNRALERMGAKVYKKYRIYDKPI